MLIGEITKIHVRLLSQLIRVDGPILNVLAKLNDFQNWSILNTVFYQNRSNDNCQTLFEDFEWPDLISNNIELKFSTKLLVETFVYCIQLDQTARFDSFLTSLTQVWPLMTFYDLIWPQLILNFDSRQNSKSKNMNIWYISTNRADLTAIGRI